MPGQPPPTPPPPTDPDEALADDHYLAVHVEDVPTGDLVVRLPDGLPVEVYVGDDGRRYGRHPSGFTVCYDEEPPRGESDGLEGK